MEIGRINKVYEKAERIIKKKLTIFCFQNKLPLSDMEYFMIYVKQAEDNFDIRQGINDMWDYSSEADINIIAYILFKKAILIAENILEVDKLIKEKLGIDWVDITIVSSFWLIEDLKSKMQNDTNKEVNDGDQRSNRSMASKRCK